ncbi:hypothetical protein Droror1_Dr00002036 [Drosera rotundifolia]
MWRIRSGYYLLNSSYLVAAHFNSVNLTTTHFSNFIFCFDNNPTSKAPSNSSSFGPVFDFFNFASFGYCSLISPQVSEPLNVRACGHDGIDSGEGDDLGVDGENVGGADDADADDDEDEENGSDHLGYRDENFDHEVGVVLGILRSIGSRPSVPENPGLVTCAEARSKLDDCGVSVTPELVVEVLSRARNDWEAAYMFFFWAGKQPGYVHCLRALNSMVSILAKKRKFDTAWALINEMGRDETRIVTPDTLMIMIRRYCAVHDVGSAINTYHAFKRFGFPSEKVEFQKLLSALCRYKNVQDAETLLFSNRDTFPFETKSFNIILNGWFNIEGKPREGKRFWKVMIERGVRLDVVSFSSIISSYSKSNKLKEVFRFYDWMKRIGIAPDRKVYNAVIHALAKAGLVKEAFNLVKTMEDCGIPPNVVTYNSLIKPLCRAKKREEALRVLDEILRRGLQPTIRTYHAFMRIQRTAEEVFQLLDQMKKIGCPPTKDTYIMLIRKLCRWQQLDGVFKLWDEMNEKGMNDDCSSYIVLIHGLFLNAKMEEAHRIYLEMKERSLLPDPKTDELIQTWLSNKQMAESPSTDSDFSIEDSDHDIGKTGFSANRVGRGRDCQDHLEDRKVVRDRGFSFWQQ